MKAIVHIGTEKTGTSSIQLFLRKNRRALEAQGYHFLQSAGKTNNWALPAYFAEERLFDDFYRFQELEEGMPLEEFRKQFIGKFEAEIRSLGKNVHTVVISSEHFHSRLRTDGELDNFRALMARFFDEVRIICYLREQADTCTSWYSTSMKSGSTHSFYSFVRRCRPESYYFNYFEVLANWERHFGADAMNVAVFDHARFLNGNLLDDFVSRIDPKLVGKLDNSIQPVNESLQPMGQALCRALNIALPPSDRDQSINDMRSRCKDLVSRRLTGKGQAIDFAQRQEIYEGFRESNEALRRRYFPDMEQLFPPPTESVVQQSSVDGELTGVISELFGVLEDGGRKPLSPDDYTRYWAAITRCIRDVIDVPAAVKQGGVEVILTEDDAQALRKAAALLEWENLQEAERALAIAQAVSPDIPGINVKLEEYRTRLESEESTADKERFIITYHGINELPEEVFLAYEKKMTAWLMDLDVPSGFHRVIPINNPAHRAVKSGIEPIHDPSMKCLTLFRARSLDEALAIAERSPYIEEGGHLEVFRLEDL